MGSVEFFEVFFIPGNDTVEVIFQSGMVLDCIFKIFKIGNERKLNDFVIHGKNGDQQLDPPDN